MNGGYHILVVDDEREIRELVKEILQDEGYEVSVAENGERAREARRQRRPDLILLDVWMPDIDGISLLREWSAHGGLEQPVIMISGHGTVETAVEATRLGAYDFVEKPLSLSKLLLVCQRALEADRLRRENINLKRLSQALHEPIGSSAVMCELREQVRRVAQHNARVLITGEPGSGKQVIARYLHDCSARAAGPFIDVGAASISGEGALAELFGHEDAEDVHYGLIEQANGGSLLIRAVGDMSPPVQAKLLSALENRSFLRVGGRDPVQFDVRLIAASYRDLEKEVAAGRFRQDLYYQMNVVPIRIPALREHRSDIPELLDYYSQIYAARENLPGRPFSKEAIARLKAHAWAGNVRELINTLQRLLILSGGPEVTLDDVERALGVHAQHLGGGIPVAVGTSLRDARSQFEKAYFEYQLGAAGGNMGKVAQRAGIERTHLYRKLRALGIRARQEGSDE